MSPSLMRIAIFGLTALTGTTSAVSLASFTPRVNNLPSSCAIVYNTKIDGCQAEDFQPNAVCSRACVLGLLDITDAVQSGCADVDVGETSIIGVFQNSLGLASLCPNTPVTTITPSSSATRTTAQAQSSTQAAQSTTATTLRSTTSTATSDQPSSTSTGAIVLDPSATATSVSPPSINTASKPVASPTQGNVNSQLSNADSGGGSPFDVQATGSSTQLHSAGVSLGALFMTTFFLVACV